MGDARICLLPVRVVEVVHRFPAVDWMYHDLSFSSEISSLTIETRHFPGTEETNAAFLSRFHHSCLLCPSMHVSHY